MTPAGPRFQVGGAVRPEAWYCRRAADDRLPEALLAGRWAAVLAPRQMGKSSLRVRTAAALDDRVRVASVDLTVLGTGEGDAAGWFTGLVEEVAAELGVDAPAPPPGPPGRALLGFFDGLLDAGPLVLFLDEIDVLRQVRFAGDVLGALRAAHERAAADPRWARLTVCLVGAVTPDALSAAAGTPFNVGTRIALGDFTRAELAPLEGPLGAAHVDAIHAWTAGHPYMTTRLAAALGEGRPVEALVEHLFLTPGATVDTNLAAAEREMALEDGGAPERIETYRRVLRAPLPLADVRAPLVDALVLTGMVAVREGGLHPRNRVIGAVFDAAWADRHLGRRSLAGAVRAWADGGWRDEDLPRGRALVALRAWADGRTDLTPDESRLLLRAGEVLAEEAARRDAEARRVEAEHVARVRGRLVAGLVVLTVALAASAGALVHANGVARDEARRTNVLLYAAQSTTLARTPRLGDDALALAAAAVALDPGFALPEATRALADVLAARQGRLFGTAGPRVAGVACGSDGTVLSRDTDGITRAWDRHTGAGVHTWTAGAADAPPVGSPLADGVAGATLGPPDREGLRRLVRLDGPAGYVLHDEGAGPRLVDPGGLVSRLVGHNASGMRWAAFTSTGLLTLGFDDTLRRWDLATGTEVGAFLLHRAEPTAVAVCDGGLWVVTGDISGRVGVWEVAAGAGSGVLPVPDGPLGVAWAGDRLLSVDEASTPRWRDPFTGLEGPPAGPAVPTTWEVDPTGRRVFLGDVPGVREGGVVRPLPGDGRIWGRAAWSGDGRAVAASAVDGAVTRWDVADGSVRGRWTLPAGVVATPAFAADGRLAVGATDGGVWELADPPRRIGDHGSLVAAVAWSPDGATIASVALDHTAVLWDVATGRERARLRGHASHVRAVAWSPDGRWLATGGDDRTVRLWDLGRGETVAVYRGHTDVVRQVGFSADGRWIASVADDRLAIVFPGRPEVLVAEATR